MLIFNTGNFCYRLTFELSLMIWWNKFQCTAFLTPVCSTFSRWIQPCLSGIWRTPPTDIICFTVTAQQCESDVDILISCTCGCLAQSSSLFIAASVASHVHYCPLHLHLSSTAICLTSSGESNIFMNRACLARGWQFANHQFQTHTMQVITKSDCSAN